MNQPSACPATEVAVVNITESTGGLTTVDYICSPRSQNRTNGQTMSDGTPCYVCIVVAQMLHVCHLPGFKYKQLLMSTASNEVHYGQSQVCQCVCLSTAHKGSCQACCELHPESANVQSCSSAVLKGQLSIVCDLQPESGNCNVQLCRSASSNR